MREKQNINIAQRRKLRGLTLVELLIVIAIVGIMASVTLVLMGGNKAQAEIDAASEELAEHLRDMRRRALSGDPDTSVKACAFGVYFSAMTTAVDTYRTFYAQSAPSCPTAYSTTGTNTPALQTRTDARVQFTANAQDFVFSTPFGAITAGSGGSVTVSHVSGSGTSKCVTLNANGSVEISGGACP